MDKPVPDESLTSEEIKFKISILEASISSLSASGQATTDLRMELAKLLLEIEGLE
jgi:hypothetical protein